MKSNSTHEEQKIERVFKSLRTDASRSAEKAALRRSEYITNVKVISSQNHRLTAVSDSPSQRLKGWITQFFPLLRKERFGMATLLTTALLITSLIFGGAGATAYAAEGSLPDELLYPVKMFTEQLRLEITGDTQAELQLHLAFAARRASELAAQASNGQELDSEAANNLQAHLGLALNLAAGLDNDGMVQALQQIQSQIRQQEQLLAGAQASLPENALLTRLRSMLQVQNQLCDLGLQNPQMLRTRLQQQQSQPETPPAEPPVTTNQVSPGPNAGAGSGTSTGPGPYPAPGSGGNGTSTGGGTCPDCVPPQDGTGSGPGPNPDPGGQDTCQQNCDPVQDGTGPGSGPNPDPGPGGGNNPSAPPESGGDSGSSGGSGSGKP